MSEKRIWECEGEWEQEEAVVGVIEDPEVVVGIREGTRYRVWMVWLGETWAGSFGVRDGGKAGLWRGEVWGCSIGDVAQALRYYYEEDIVDEKVVAVAREMSEQKRRMKGTE